MEDYKKDEDLKPFFDALKQHSSEPVSLDQVKKQVSVLGKNKKNKHTAMNITIIISLTAGILAFYSHRTSSGTLSGIRKEVRQHMPLLNPVPPNVQASGPVAGSSAGAVLPDTDAAGSTRMNQHHIVKSRFDYKLHEPFKKQSGIISPVDTSKLTSSKPGQGIPMQVQRDNLAHADSSSHSTVDLSFPFPVVRLSVEELEKLGIYSGDGCIIYESLKYTDEPFSFYYLPGSSSMSYSEDNIQFKNYFPVLLTDRYFQHVHIMPYLFTYKTPRDEIRAATKDLIPVVAYSNPNPKASFYEEHIFWFSKTDEVIGQMPLRVQQDIRDNKYVWDLTKDSIPYTEEIAEMDKRLANDFIRNKEDKTIAFDSSDAIYADAALLKKLNITVIGKFSCIDYKYKSLSYQHTIHINPKTGDTGVSLNINIGKEKEIANAQKKRKVPLYRFSHELPFTPLSIDGVGSRSGSHNYTPYQDYLLQKHALIPVIVKAYRAGSQHVYWYYPTPNFLKLLNEEQLKKASLYLEKHKNDSLILSRYYVEKNHPKRRTYQDLKNLSAPAFAFTKLELDSQTLHKLGIEIHDKSVSYFFKSDSSFIETNFSKKGTQISFDKKQEATYPATTAMIITDDLGRYPRMSFDSTEFNTVDFNTLVPVYAKTNDVYTSLDMLRQSWRPDVIFWFRPDSFFLSTIPSKIAKPMVSDIKMIEQDSSGGSCQYFDVCKSLTPSITSHRFFPNPATNSLHVTLKTIAPANITIQLFDMSGKPAMEELSFGTNDNALNEKINISELLPGIYNVVLQTSLGDKVISRIIVIH